MSPMNQMDLPGAFFMMDLFINKIIITRKLESIS